MAAKYLFLAILLVPFVGLNAQDVASDYEEYQNRKPQTTAAASEQRYFHLNITCEQPQKLSNLTIKGKGVNLSYEWGGESESNVFPMQIRFKSEKVKIQYKTVGHDWATLDLQLDMGSEKNLKLEIPSSQCQARPTGTKGASNKGLQPMGE